MVSRLLHNSDETLNGKVIYVHMRQVEVEALPFINIYFKYSLPRNLNVRSTKYIDAVQQLNNKEIVKIKSTSSENLNIF